jgi:threonine synthase
MDVGSFSNFVRILQLFDREFQSLKKVMSSYAFSDEETMAIIKEVFLNTKYLLDPHGAIGYGALRKYMQLHPCSGGIFLETAHPVKFYDVVEPVIGEKVPMPDVVNDLLKLKKKSIKMDVKYKDFRDYLLKK